MTQPFGTISEAIAELQAGRFVILVDDEQRENEGDLVCAAEMVTPERPGQGSRLDTHGLRASACGC
jgi:3,4-dihydroxy-2-butanone 4-phosphate synthase